MKGKERGKEGTTGIQCMSPGDVVSFLFGWFVY